MPATEAAAVSPSSAAPRGAIARHRFFSPARVWALATNTLTELIRLKVFYFLLLFGLFLIGSSLFFIQFNFQDQFQMLKDISLGSMSIFTSLLAILATAGLLPKDIEDRTLYTILAKPVPRLEYLLGKLLGVMLLLLITLAAMGALFALVLNWRVLVITADLQAANQAAAAGVANPQEILAQQIRDLHNTAFNSNLWAGAAVIYMKACLLASLTLFISTFASSSLFTIIVALVVYFIGHMQGTAREYWQASNGLEAAGGFSKVFLAFVTVVFPDLQLFNLVDDIVVGMVIAPLLLIKTLGLGVMYFVFYLLASFFVFSFKEL